MKIKGVYTYGQLTDFIVVERTKDDIDITMAVLPPTHPIEYWSNMLMPHLKKIDQELPVDSVVSVVRANRVTSLLRSCGVMGRQHA